MAKSGGGGGRGKAYLFKGNVRKMDNSTLRDEFILARRYFMLEAGLGGKVPTLTANMEQAARQMVAAEREARRRGIFGRF